QAEDGIRDFHVTGVQTCALPIYAESVSRARPTSVAGTRTMVPSFVTCLSALMPTSSKADKASFPSGSVMPVSKSTLPVQAARKRSEERRVGKEGRSGWRADHESK